MLQQGPEPRHPHSTRTDQWGFLTHLVPSGEISDAADICSQEWWESVASGREKEGLEVRWEETRRPRHTGMGFQARKL